MNSLRILPVCLLLVLALFASACGQSSTWAEGVVEANISADRALENEDWSGARTALLRLTEEAPSGVSAEDSRVVAADAYYRLARLEMNADDATAALSWAEAGLALGGEDVFTANLLVARGRANERLGQATDAAADYHDALLINEALLDQLLDEAP